jgi:hypothetical protein
MTITTRKYRPRPAHQVPPSPARDEAIGRAIAEGGTLRQVGSRFGLSHQRVRDLYAERQRRLGSEAVVAVALHAAGALIEAQGGDAETKRRRLHLAIARLQSLSAEETERIAREALAVAQSRRRAPRPSKYRPDIKPAPGAEAEAEADMAMPSTGAPPPLTDETLLSRSRVAEELTRAGFKIAVATLAGYATRGGGTRGGGPPYEVWNGKPLYRWADARAWAQTRFARLVVHTTEVRQRLAAKGHVAEPRPIERDYAPAK